MTDGFDYGATPVTAEQRKNASVGLHSARLRSIIHLGDFRATYKGQLKKPAPHVVAIFELLSDEQDVPDVQEDGSPMEIDKDFGLKTGDRAFMPKFRARLDPTKQASSFDGLIGSPCFIDIKGGVELNEDKTPKFVNFGELQQMTAKLIPHTPDLKVKGVGHVRFEDLTKEAILELHPIRHVARILMQAENYKGSKAEAIIAEIKADDPTFAVYKKKEEEEGQHEARDEQQEPAAPLTKVASTLSPTQEY